MENISLSPIVLFVYNRSEHTKKTIEALIKNKYASESELFIFSDGPKKNDEDRIRVENVRKLINSIDGFRKIIIEESPNNKGLANSVISGVTKVIDKYEKVIVLEDDIVTGEDFLYYMNKGLDFYKNNKKIWSITGCALPIEIPKEYSYDIYLSLWPASWSYGTWKDRWQKTDWDVKDYDKLKKSKIKQFLFSSIRPDTFNLLKAQMDGYVDSWAIRWTYSQYKEKAFSIFPVTSYIQNIGYDGSGAHCDVTDKFNTIIDHELYSVVFSNNLKLNRKLVKSLKTLFVREIAADLSQAPRKNKRILSGIKRIIKCILRPFVRPLLNHIRMIIREEIALTKTDDK